MEHEERAGFAGRDIMLRPIRPEDETQHAQFLARVDPQDLQLRFFHAIRLFPHSELARLTQIDYDREMAFIAISLDDPNAPETLGVVRALSDADRISAEFAILVRSDLKGKGLGALLMSKLVTYCRERGIGQLAGEVVAGNDRMLALARDVGFKITPGGDPGTCRVTLDLAAGRASRQDQPGAAPGRQSPHRPDGRPHKPTQSKQSPVIHK